MRGWYFMYGLLDYSSIISLSFLISPVFTVQSCHYRKHLFSVYYISIHELYIHILCCVDSLVRNLPYPNLRDIICTSTRGKHFFTPFVGHHTLVTAACIQCVNVFIKLFIFSSWFFNVSGRRSQQTCFQRSNALISLKRLKIF